MPGHYKKKKKDELKIAGGPSFDINESGKTRKIRSIRKLQEGSKGGEKDAAGDALKKLSGPQLPLAKKKKKKKKTYTA